MRGGKRARLARPKAWARARGLSTGHPRACPHLVSRRGAGVVDRGGLENRCACKRTVGSNPTLSAIFPIAAAAIAALARPRVSGMANTVLTAVY